ncbi:MAG: hypothetical protein JWQ68_1446 [Cryobacterium sp.]|jgi:hypothetical protein|nr:hypothetical protein [Cryobacterium sp.]
MIPVLGFLLSNTPPPAETVTPGPLGFAAIFVVALLTVLLGFDMVRRVRRTTYREEIRKRLEDERAARDAGGGGRPE